MSTTSSSMTIPSGGSGKTVPLGQGTRKYLTFKIDTEWFGVDLLKVREILEYCPVRKVPMTTSVIEGVINLRGHILPVVNLSIRLQKNRNPLSERTCIIIVDVSYKDDTVRFGTVVDEISKVLLLSEQDISTPPSIGLSIPQYFVSGMGKVGNDFVKLLDLQAVLDVESLSQEVRAAH